MGHWEQIGVENREARERRAAWPRWRRELWRYWNVAVPAVAGGLLLAGLLWLLRLV